MDYFDGKNVVVTGGSGFVGSHVADALVKAGARVTVYDNGSVGNRQFINESARLIEGDLLAGQRLDEALTGQDIVFHFAAIADIRQNLTNPGHIFDQNVSATLVLLNYMRRHNARHIAFASSGAVYGKPVVVPTREDDPFPIQTSIYGASKLASEALISAYCAGFDMRATIYRFTPMLGERYSHGHIFDFVKKLRASPRSITVLGTGKERKFSLHVSDAVQGILLGAAHDSEAVEIFNIGGNNQYTIAEAVAWVADQLCLMPDVTYTGTTWAGDNPNLHLDCSRIRRLGWRQKVGVQQTIQRTVQYLIDNPALLERES